MYIDRKVCNNVSCRSGKKVNMHMFHVFDKLFPVKTQFCLWLKIATTKEINVSKQYGGMNTMTEDANDVLILMHHIFIQS